MSGATRQWWHGWQLNDDITLSHPSCPTYEIDVETMTSSAEVLDWVLQLAGKTWADDALLVGFIRAVTDIVDPQATLCSWGNSHELTEEAVRARALYVLHLTPTLAVHP